MFMYSRGPVLRRVLNIPGSTQRRTLARYPVTSPLGRLFHRVSTAVVKGVGLFYVSAFVFGGVGYAGFSYYISKPQHISSEWPFLASQYAKAGVYYQNEDDDYTTDHQNEIEHFNEALKRVGESEGEVLEAGSKGKFKLLPLDKLSKKSKDWQRTYVDVIIRLAIAKAEIGDLDNASKLVMYSTAIPIDIGSTEMRSKSLRLFSKILQLKGDIDETQKAENYLLDAVRYNEIHQDDIRFLKNGSLLLDPSSKLNRETFESLLDLGILYSKTARYSQSLEIFLNLLQIAETDNFKEIKQLKDEALLKNYISELLYKKGMVENSLKWAQDAYTQASFFAKTNIQSAIISKQALQNCIALYKKLGNETKAMELEKKLQEIVIPERNDSFGKSLLDLIFN